MTESNRKYWVILFVILIYGALLYLYFDQFDQGFSIKNDNWGTFGDFVGGSLSPIIGIISIVLTYTIINNQNREGKQSEFKYMFQILFDSIDQKREIIERKAKPVAKGKKAIKRIVKDIEAVYTFQRMQNPTEESLKLFREAFWSVYDEIDGTPSPYMKVLHNCIKSVDKHCDYQRRDEYSALLRAQLHSDELVFIFYNGIAHDDFSNFKKRIEKYSLLKEINNYPFPAELKALYDGKAFNESDKKIKKLFHYNKNFSVELKLTLNKK